MSALRIWPAADLVPGWDEPLENHYFALSDGSDLTSVRSFAPALDRYEVPPLPSTVIGLSSVTVSARIQSSDGLGLVRVRLRSGVDLSSGPIWTAPIVPATLSATLARPGGGGWTPAAWAACDLELEAVSTAFSLAVCLELFVDFGGLVLSTTAHRRRAVGPGLRLGVGGPGARLELAGPSGARPVLPAPVGRPKLSGPGGSRAALAGGPSDD